MAQFTIYRSTDSSAPVLSGGSGSLINVLNNVLVNGYGSQAAAGWSLAYNASSTRVAFRMGGGNQGYLNVYDENVNTGIAPASGRGAYISGYETMSAFDVGTNVFPPASTSATSRVAIRKSATSDTTARPWIIAADDRTIYMFVQTGDSANTYCGWGFGDYYSFKTNDPHRMIIMGRYLDSAGSPVTDEGIDVMNTWISNAVGTATIAGHYIPKSYVGMGPAVNVGKHGKVDLATAISSTYHKTMGVVPFTNPEDSSIYISPIWIHDPTNSSSSTFLNALCGRLRGFYHWLHPVTSVADGDTFSGSGNLAGKTFLIIKSAPNGGIFVIETSATLETN